MRVRDHQWDGIWVRWPHSAMLSPAVPCVGGEGRGAGVPGIGGGWRRQASRHSSGMNVLVRGAATQGRTPAHSLSAAVVTAHAETFRSRHPGTCHRARRGISGYSLWVSASVLQPTPGDTWWRHLRIFHFLKGGRRVVRQHASAKDGLLVGNQTRAETG
jgi:hypothetical protein